MNVSFTITHESVDIVFESKDFFRVYGANTKEEVTGIAELIKFVRFPYTEVLFFTDEKSKFYDGPVLDSRFVNSITHI